MELQASEAALQYWKMLLEGYDELRSRPAGIDLTSLPEYQFLSFFVFAHHLVDHIKADQAPAARKAVDEHVRKNKALSRCREICLTTKHFELTQSEPLGARRPTYDESKSTIVVDNAGPVSIRQHRTITFHDGTQMEALELATAIVHAWEASGLPVNPAFWDPDSWVSRHS